jgi:hypothetical protein
MPSSVASLPRSLNGSIVRRTRWACWTPQDWCPNAAGGTSTCGVPDHLPSIVGGAVTVTGTGANRKFGPWRSIDLGTQP